MSEVWFRDPNNTDRAWARNLVNLRQTPDASGTVNIDTILPGVIPADAVSLILTIERTWIDIPPGGTGSLSLRAIPGGHNLQTLDYIDRVKTQEWIVSNTGVDGVAQDCRMPITPVYREFFWSLQSSHPTFDGKLVIIDCWGYVTP